MTEPLKVIRYKGGAGWAEDPYSGQLYGETPPQGRGNISVAERDGLYLYRTGGKPTSMQALFDDFGEHILDAANRFDLRPSFIMACIGVEAVRGPKNGPPERMRPDGSRWRWDPRSCRYESHIDDSSPGLMQTLTRTAEQMRRRYVPQLDRIPTGGRVRSSDDHPLFDPATSIMLGAAYMRYQIERIEPDESGLPPDDPILNMVAAYNAGSVRPAANRWNLRTYSPTRIDDFIAWNNDAVVVLEALGIWNGEIPKETR